MRTRLRVCAMKTRYANRDDALRAAGKAEFPLRAYRCDRCWQFHLTSRIKCRCQGPQFGQVSSPLIRSRPSERKGGKFDDLGS